jgi:hypothetical protein
LSGFGASPEKEITEGYAVDMLWSSRSAEPEKKMSAQEIGDSV